MTEQSFGILENYKSLGVGIIEFALDDYISTIKSLRTYYKKLDRCFEEGFKARKFHERMGDVCLDIYHRIQNLNDIEKFLTGDWVQTLSDMDVYLLFQETKRKLRKKGYRVGLMGLTVTTDDKGVTVFANEKEGAKGKYVFYSIGVSTKNKESNTWVNGFINCRFKTGVVVANKTKIKINSAFFFASKYGDKTYTNLMITDFDILEPGDSSGDPDDFVKIPDNVDEEVPFL